MSKRSRPIAVQFYIDEEEQEWLNATIKDTHASLSDYIRDKLFYENQDFDGFQERYITPSVKKHNLISTTLQFRTIQLIKQLLARQGCSEQEINQLDDISIESAKNQRSINGYDVIRIDKQHHRQED